MPIRWNKELSVGVPMIDAQHRELIDRANNHLGQVRQWGELTELESLRSLVTFLRLHCTAEETLMRRCGYPGHAQHRDEHRASLAKMDAFIAYRLEHGDTPTVVVSVNNLVCEWFFKHIRSADMELGEFVRRWRAAPREALVSA